MKDHTCNRLYCNSSSHQQVLFSKRKQTLDVTVSSENVECTVMPTECIAIIDFASH